MEKPDSKTLARWGAVFMAALAVGWIIWLVATGKAESFWHALIGANPLWAAAGMMMFVMYFLLDSLCFRIAGTLTGVRLGIADLISTAAVGIVFGYLTPGQVGAAPAQIVRLAKAGLSPGDASAIQLTRFFIYQSAVTIFGTLMLIVKFPYFKSIYGNVTLIAALALCVHLGIMAMLVGLIFFPNLIRRIAGFGIRLLSQRMHVIKNPQKATDAVEDQISQYATSVHAATHHVGVMVSAIVITIIQIVCIYTIPHFVLLSFGVSDTDTFTDIAAAAFVQLILTAVPLPGGTGGAEGGFALFFGPVLGDLTSTAVVLWRLITFYLPVIVSFPLIAVKSSVSPQERLNRYGEAKVGVAAIADDLGTARETVNEVRVQAGIEYDVRRRRRETHSQRSVHARSGVRARNRREMQSRRKGKGNKR